ncbi:MAG: CAP domain-containing protein [Paracoccus denitrificans]|uniref:CAP domain-containing protein n=1 Tax=Paracoccus denitrificans TaxID=266 RepID=A0A533IFW6_PARDE|nr:MAG: CAP domain-containing protein [Paracoccus denitrificans]
MFRQLFGPLTIALSSSVLALGACSPENLATAGDSARTVSISPMGDPTLPAPAVESLGPTCAAADPAMVAQMQERMNAERVALGRSPLEFVDNLTFAAQAHACDMATMGRATVAGSNGSSVVHRVRAVEYSACSSAQLIGRSGDAYSQMSTWMGHEPDEEVLVHQKFDDAGVGVVNMGGRLWWSVVMADDCR